MSVKSNVLLIVFFSLVTSVFGQYNSLFSPYGVGQVVQSQSAQLQAIGGASVAVRDSQVINFSNPSSYSAFGLATFESGLKYQAANQQIANAPYADHNVWMSHLMVGMPIWKNKIGMAFGTKSDYSQSYDFSLETLNARGDSVGYTTIGSGEINSFFIGVGGAVYSNNTSRLDIGMNYRALFGGILKKEAFYQIDASSEIQDVMHTENRFVKGGGFDLGASYSKFWRASDKKYDLTIAGNLVSAAQMSGSRDVLEEIGSYSKSLQTLRTGSSQRYTLIDLTDAGTLVLPSVYSFGLSYSRKPINLADEVTSWRLSIDASQKNYSQMEMDGTTLGFSDSRKLAVGFEWKPAPKPGRRSMDFRVGTFGEQMHLVENNSQFLHYGMTFGVGLPVYKSKNTIKRNLSMLNLSLIAGRRGNGLSTSASEMYIGGMFGITINNKWFYRQRIQ